MSSDKKYPVGYEQYGLPWITQEAFDVLNIPVEIELVTQLDP